MDLTVPTLTVSITGATVELAGVVSVIAGGTGGAVTRLNRSPEASSSLQQDCPLTQLSECDTNLPRHSPPSRSSLTQIPNSRTPLTNVPHGLNTSGAGETATCVSASSAESRQQDCVCSQMTDFPTDFPTQNCVTNWSSTQTPNVFLLRRDVHGLKRVLFRWVSIAFGAAVVAVVAVVVVVVVVRGVTG